MGDAQKQVNVNIDESVSISNQHEAKITGIIVGANKVRISVEPDEKFER